MNYLKEFINTYSIPLIHSIFITIISYISLKIKNIYQKHTELKIKKEVTNMVCKAINQLYPNLTKRQKLNKAITNIKKILKEKNIIITTLELRLYIESTINTLKSGDKL